MQKLPVWELIVHVLSFWVKEWRSVAQFTLVPFGAIYVLLAVLVLLGFPLASLFPFYTVVVYGFMAIQLLGSLVLASMASCALFRLVVLGQRPDDGYLSGINFGRPELVMIGLMVLFPVSFIVPGGAVLIAFDAVGAPETEVGAITVLLLTIGATVAFLWLRFALVWLIAAVRGEFAWRESWRLTSGNALRLGVMVAAASAAPIGYEWLFEWWRGDESAGAFPSFASIVGSYALLVLQTLVLGRAYLLLAGVPDEAAADVADAGGVRHAAPQGLNDT